MIPDLPSETIMDLEKSATEITITAAMEYTASEMKMMVFPMVLYPIADGTATSRRARKNRTATVRRFIPKNFRKNKAASPKNDRLFVNSPVLTALKNPPVKKALSRNIMNRARSVPEIAKEPTLSNPAPLFEIISRGKPSPSLPVTRLEPRIVFTEVFRGKEINETVSAETSQNATTHRQHFSELCKPVLIC